MNARSKTDLEDMMVPLRRDTESMYYSLKVDLEDLEDFVRLLSILL